MGTKNNPGPYDCYAKADGDEPIFTLRAKDPSAPYLTMIWEASRRGDIAAVSNLAMAMMMNKDVIRLFAAPGESCDKFKEAIDCAQSMREWRTANVTGPTQS
jgi:hypothetical protein